MKRAHNPILKLGGFKNNLRTVFNFQFFQINVSLELNIKKFPRPLNFETFDTLVFCMRILACNCENTSAVKFRKNLALYRYIQENIEERPEYWETSPAAAKKTSSAVEFGKILALYRYIQKNIEEMPGYTETSPAASEKNVTSRVIQKTPCFLF